MCVFVFVFVYFSISSVVGYIVVRGSLGMLVCEDKVVQIISRQMASNHSLLARPPPHT